MEINGKKVKTIRLMTDSELKEYDPILLIQRNVFCIEFEDGSLLLPKENCVICMQRNECLFSLIPKMP